MTTVIDKLLYGIKVTNDNIIVLNEKLDKILSLMGVEEEHEDTPQDEVLG